MKNALILVMGLVLLSSCEKETYVEHFIENRSTSTITVNGTDIIDASGVDHTIPAGQKVAISSWAKRGKQTDLFPPTMMFGDDMIITNASGDTLTKDYTVLSNWSSDVEDKRATARHDYVLIISDNDF